MSKRKARLHSTKAKNPGARGGVMKGMRRGFKDAAHTVAGEKTTKKKNPVNTLITLALIGLVGYFVYERFIA